MMFGAAWRTLVEEMDVSLGDRIAACKSADATMLMKVRRGRWEANSLDKHPHRRVADASEVVLAASVREKKGPLEKPVI